MSPVRLFGVVDCARAPALYEHVARLTPEAADCLFAGKVDEELRRASPHIVELAPQDPLSRLWRTEGWGQAWGVLVFSQGTLASVRRRLRHFTLARLPDGSGPMLFRFWDPRVLRVYLPLVEPDAIGAWFEGIDRYMVESEDGQTSLRYRLAGGKLQVETAARPGV